MKKQLTTLKCKISCQSSGSLTDYQYNSNGTQVAISDSQGNIYIYQKTGEGYLKTASFAGDDAAIWKVSWAHPKYGKTLAIGSFKKKVAIFQERNMEWVQVASHQLHQGSVNHVCWAPAPYGLKLYAAGSDGKVSIMELKGNSWHTSSFTAHSWAINSMDIEQLPINQQQENLQHLYPRIATVSKDQSIKIWMYGSQNSESYTGSLFSQNSYTLYFSHTPHKQMIRSILWRPLWARTKNDEYQIISCSQDGTVKIFTYQGKSIQSQQILLEQEYPVTKIAQSETGNMLSVSVASNTGDSGESTYLYIQKDVNEWECLRKFDQI